ncbi:MAG: DNA polymerase III subunit [Elusimicrobia bacterium]|nr:DNA polymerase III subunit [Elusimicrobiota bacterium]MBI3012824.1 DNA polymerase III subunit [Elusimicrobiota bacterium]
MVLGQTQNILWADLRAGRVAESYLLVGGSDGDRRAAALEFAQSLNCQGGTLGFREGPCGDCSSCHRIKEENHPDVFRLDFESQGNLLALSPEKKAKQKEYQIDAVRLLVERAYLSPLEAREKIFIIDGAERLSEESANALLKVLEESPSKAHWLLLTCNPDQVIPTVRSRCRKIPLDFPLSGARDEKDPEIEKWVQESLERKGKNAIALASRILADRKPGQQKKDLAQFLKVLSGKMEERLRDDPSIENVGKLETILQSQIDLERNVSPQLLCETVLFSL